MTAASAVSIRASKVGAGDGRRISCWTPSSSRAGRSLRASHSARAESPNTKLVLFASTR